MTLAVLRPGSPLGATVLFVGGGRPWTADDAVADAHARGALDRAIAETLELHAAESEGVDVDVDDQVLQRESERYRYEHDLITAGETEEWLAARGMTLEDFAGWLHRRLCRGAMEPRLQPGNAPPAEAGAPSDFPEQLLIHLWLSGEMERISEQFRRRVAAQIEAGANVSIDAAYDRLARAALSDDARRRKLESMRLPLTRLHIDSLELESEAAAREACLCIRDDKQSLAAVAAGAGYKTRRDVMWAEDTASLSPHAPFASAGELIGPIRAGNEFKIYEVVRRVEPSLADADVAARVDAKLLDETFEALCSRHTQLPVIARTT